MTHHRDEHVVLITGAASGIGAATAFEVARRGGVPVIVDVDPRGEEVARQTGGPFIRADVSDPDAWKKIVAEALGEFRRISGAHLNAGIVSGPHQTDFLTVDDSTYRRVMGVNCDGVYFGIKALVPGMAEHGGGSIVVSASVRGIWPGPGDPVYAMSKHALVGLVRSLAEPLATRGVRINAICPGPTETGINKSSMPSEVRATLAFQEAGRVAEVVTDLLAADSSGEIVTVIAGKVAKPRLPEPEYRL